jgi:transcriptional regulator
MYLPTAFKETDHAQLIVQIEACSLALLITDGESGMRANHVPLLLTQQKGNATLHGHLAKANPQWRDLATGTPALVVFSGPDAYVSPGFYPSKVHNPAVVPTWNYISVQARGTPEVFDAPERLYALVAALTQRHEAGRAEPWSIKDAPTAYIQSMLKAIVGFSIPVEQLQGKRKLSQNRSMVDQQGVATQLAKSAYASEHALAMLMNNGREGSSLNKEQHS